MKNKIVMLCTCAAILCGMPAASVYAAVPLSEITESYDQAVKLQDELDGIDVSVKETTVVPGKRTDTQKVIEMQVSGLQKLDQLKAAITIKTGEGEKKEYYADGYFYSNRTGQAVKYAMNPEEMLEILNYYVCLDLNSTRLSALVKNGSSYTFNATADTLGGYEDKILEGVQADQKISLVALMGTVDTDGDSITRRHIQTVYTMRSGDEPQTCTVDAEEVFHNPGQAVKVTLPDLTKYAEQKEEQAAVVVTPLARTLYASYDVNIRAQNSITAAILGGAVRGTALEQTGYTSDGWVQIRFNGAVGYVSADCVSEVRPIVITAMSGTMYATVSVNVRESAGTDGAILGVLSGGDAVKVTGWTDNGWVQISYKGLSGYVSGSYLTWDIPVTAMGGTMYVVNEQANVRAYYSTDSEVLGVLERGLSVEVTGYTPNNWIRVTYKGNTGYIYGDLLSWNAPKTFSYGYVDGIVESISANTLNLYGSDGNYYYFSTAGAYKDTRDGLAAGDSAGVYYTEKNGSLTATEIIDYLSQGSGTEDSGLIYGTVVAGGMSTVTLACDDGETRTFDKSDAEVYCENGLYVGLYVSAAYYYDSARGYILTYLANM